jgi:hypothetical protein
MRAMDSTLDLDWLCPINWMNPLTVGLISKWLAIPGVMGSSKFIDLCNPSTGNHGTLTNGPTWQGATGRQGGFGSLSMEGTAHVAMGSVAIGATFSIAIWLRWTAWQSATAVYEFGNRPQMLLFRNGADSRLTALSLDDAAYQVATTNAVDDGAWHHIVVTWENSVAMNVYQNGILASSDTSVNSMVAETVSPTFGTDTPGSANNNWNGQLDDILIYNRALSASEILALYNESRQGNPNMLNWIPTKRYFFVSAVVPPASVENYRIFRPYKSKIFKSKVF